MPCSTQLERLEEDKLTLRKQLIDKALSRKITPVHHRGDRGGEGKESVDGDLTKGTCKVLFLSSYKVHIGE